MRTVKVHGIHKVEIYYGAEKLSYFDNKLFTQIRKLAVKRYAKTKNRKKNQDKVIQPALKENFNAKPPLYPCYISKNLLKHLQLDLENESLKLKWKRFSEFLRDNCYIYEQAPPSLKLKLTKKGGAHEILYNLSGHYEHL
jgi:hypothetical protein